MNADTKNTQRADQLGAQPVSQPASQLAKQLVSQASSANNVAINDSLRRPDTITLTDSRLAAAGSNLLRNATSDNTPTREMRHRLLDRIDAIQQRVRGVDLDLHTALLYSLIGGIKGAVACNPCEIVAAVEVMEIVMEDFKPTAR